MDYENMGWTLYFQNPETCDEQGIYLKAEGEERPWQTETDAEEFDYWNEPNETGFIIRDKASAERWLEWAKIKGYVRQVVMI